MPSPWIELFKAIGEIIWENRGEILSTIDKANRDLGPHKNTAFCQDCGREGEAETVEIEGRKTLRANCPQHGTKRAKDLKT